MQTNGERRKVPGDVWVTSYWREPAIELVGQNVSLLDADKGRHLNGKLDRVGKEPIELGGQTFECTHYRLAGDVEVDLWYDANGRLARQKAVESGHKTQIELAGIGNSTKPAKGRSPLSRRHPATAARRARHCPAVRQTATSP